MATPKRNYEILRKKHLVFVEFPVNRVNNFHTVDCVSVFI